MLDLFRARNPIEMFIITITAPATVFQLALIQQCSQFASVVPTDVGYRCISGSVPQKLFPSFDSFWFLLGE